MSDAMCWKSLQPGYRQRLRDEKRRNVPYYMRRAKNDCATAKPMIRYPGEPTETQSAFLHALTTAGKRATVMLAPRSVVSACYRRGWIGTDLELTPSGRTAIEQYGGCF